jgi:hypothetical protein
VAASRSGRTGAGAGAVLVLILVLIALALSTKRHAPPPPAIGAGCDVRGQDFTVPLDPGQAGIAATIAGVARHRDMPVRAVTIAYATALQESDLENLSYGDRDSVGVFQQRPSQGWGSRHQLLDPVYASTRFFAVLATVPNYRHLLVYQAAQAVQRSADGYAYSQYAPEGAVMAAAFTGEAQRSVWCWYGGGTGRARLAAASHQLAHDFGPLVMRNVGDPSMLVRVSRPAAGWAVASWLVSHAGSYGIRSVDYQGYQWTAAHGTKGWIRVRRASGPASAGVVRFG